MQTDYNKILVARNRTKKVHKVYTYEAIKNMLDGYAGNTISENMFGIVAAYLQQTGHDMSFLKDKDLLIINKIRRVMTYNK